MKNKIYITCIGNAEDINTWSNTPYYFLKAGKKNNLFSGAIINNPEKLRKNKLLWNIKQLLLTLQYGGYQFTPSFLTKLERQIKLEAFQNTIISFNQIFPRADKIVNQGGKIYYYIDCTLNQLFLSESYGIKTSDKIKKQAIKIEKANYNKAEKIVVMAHHVKMDLIETYNIAPNRIEVILPGANMEVPDKYSTQERTSSFSKESPFTISFIGKDWKRKGLPLLIKAVDQLTKEGFPVVIETMGTNEEELNQYDFIKQYGFVNKQSDLKRFIDLVSKADLGVLLSQSEALGISVLEYQALGIPVLGFNHEGMKDTIDEEAGFKIALTQSPEAVYQILKQILLSSEELLKKRKILEKKKETFLWANTINHWKKLIYEQ